MAVPRQRKTKSARNQRRAHHALVKLSLAKCKNCGQAVRPHDICKNCGFYRGKQVIQIKVNAPAKSTK